MDTIPSGWFHKPFPEDVDVLLLLVVLVVLVVTNSFGIHPRLTITVRVDVEVASSSVTVKGVTTKYPCGPAVLAPPPESPITPRFFVLGVGKAPTGRLRGPTNTCP